MTVPSRNRASKARLLRRGVGASVATLTWALATAALALPTNPTVHDFAGGGTGATFTGGTGTLTVNQSSDRVVIDWDTFDIGSTETVTFVQPTTTSIAFNRIDPTAFTTIDGSLTANGSIWLFSPAGIIFGNSAQVNV
ncbi:MAG TPA: filamentous hemagglutinin N-terminal domain-containing protein, partial [Caulobacteraceae bacterium]|nr:filamentous hemagglutinin N-terminal domain-containing protein [Caulobacteraceae bacterium]